MSFRQYRDFDPVGSHQLPIAGSEESNALEHSAPDVFFEIIYSFDGSKILIVIGSFATNQW